MYSRMDLQLPEAKGLSWKQCEICACLHSFFWKKHHIFIMVKCCVLQFCSNSNKTGHIMHKLPKDANLRRQWVKFVQVKRADFAEPMEHSVIWNIHFSPDCDKKVSWWKWGWESKVCYFLVPYWWYSLQQQQILATKESGLSKMKAANNRKWPRVPIKGL